MTFLQPNTLLDLARCLGEKSGPDCHLIAGCTDFLAKRNGTPWDARLLISLVNLPELQDIHLDDNILSVGAACTHSQVEEHPLVRQYFPALAAACGNVGSKQVRNRGTVGGSVGNASPAGDIYPVLLVLGAQGVVLSSKESVRRLPMEELISPQGRLALAEDEAITAFEIPLPAFGNYNAFVKLGEQAHVTIAKISLAVSLTLRDGRMEQVRLALGAVARRAFLARSADALEGQPLSPDLLPAFFQALSSEIEASIPDRPSMPYKRQAVKGLADDLLSALAAQVPERP